MVYTVLVDHKKEELHVLESLARDVIAHLSEDKWDFTKFLAGGQFLEYLKEKPLIQYLCYEVNDHTIGDLRAFRGEYKDTYLLLVADATTSPLLYMKPGIMASSLLLRPWTEEMAHQIIMDFFSACIERTEMDDQDDMFSFSGQEGDYRIPFGQIYYFEAREKKIYVNTGRTEIGFYATLEELENRLSDDFVRCHRGFIANRKKIRKISLAKNTIYLCDDIEVPLSRSYKAAIKELFA